MFLGKIFCFFVEIFKIFDLFGSKFFFLTLGGPFGGSESQLGEKVLWGGGGGV